MAECPQVKALYEETIKTFTFRDSDGINIPKSVREEAYALAVDIVIVSTAREVYKNYTVTPAEGFYGNATLVMHDMCERKIPVNMPRQRIYYGRVPEAFAIWQSLVDWSYFQTYMTAIGESLVSLGTALGASVILPTNCCALPDRSWIELPLREVYFKAPFGTQYKIEVSWYKALQIEDGCGNIRNPKSKVTDGSKDSGLPPNGVQPNVASNPNNTFCGLPPATSDFEQGNFSNSKGEDRINNPSPLNNIDPNNLPDERGTFLELKIFTTTSDKNCVPWLYVAYYLVASGETGGYVTPLASVSSCGITVTQGRLFSNSGNLLLSIFDYTSYQISIIRSANLPVGYDQAA